MQPLQPSHQTGVKREGEFPENHPLESPAKKQKFSVSGSTNNQNSERFFSLLRTQLYFNPENVEIYSKYKELRSLRETKTINKLISENRVIEALDISAQSLNEYVNKANALTARKTVSLQGAQYMRTTNDPVLLSWARCHLFSDFSHHQKVLAEISIKKSKDAASGENPKIPIALDSAFSAFLHNPSEENIEWLKDIVKKYHRPGFAEALPDEIWMHIFSFLSPADLLNMEAVSLRFQGFAKSNSVWLPWVNNKTETGEARETAVHNLSFNTQKPRKEFTFFVEGEIWNNYALLKDYFIISMMINDINKEREDENSPVLIVINLDTGEKKKFNTIFTEQKVAFDCMRIADNEFLLKSSQKVDGKLGHSFQLGKISENGDVDLTTFKLEEANQLRFFIPNLLNVFGINNNNGIESVIYKFDLQTTMTNSASYKGIYKNNFLAVNSSYLLLNDEDEQVHLFHRPTNDEIELPKKIVNSEFRILMEDALYCMNANKCVVRFDIHSKDVFTFDSSIREALIEWKGKLFCRNSKKLYLFDLASKEIEWTAPFEFDEDVTLIPTLENIVVENFNDDADVIFLDWSSGNIISRIKNLGYFHDGYFISIMTHNAFLEGFEVKIRHF